MTQMTAFPVTHEVLKYVRSVFRPCDRRLLIGKADSYSPSFKDVQGLVGTGKHLPGWRLDYFVADLVMACKQGALLEQEDTDFMNSRFRRRSGPISDSFAITIDKSDAH